MSEDHTYPEGITPELLMAYADGALQPDDVAQVEAALIAHPELAEEIEAYRRTSTALSGAFDTPITEPVPAHLEALVMGGAVNGENVTSLHAAKARRTGLVPVWGQALAACAVFAIGAVFGATLLDGGSAPPDEDILVAGRLDAAHPIARALETKASAEIVEIPGGRFDAVATFPTASGAPCREFEAADGRGAIVGIACRRDGGWTIELLLQAKVTDSPQEGFQLASAFDMEVIDAVLEGLGADTSLAADREACLIENGWETEACE